MNGKPYSRKDRWEAVKTAANNVGVETQQMWTKPTEDEK